MRREEKKGRKMEWNGMMALGLYVCTFAVQSK